MLGVDFILEHGLGPDPAPLPAAFILFHFREEQAVINRGNGSIDVIYGVGDISCNDISGAVFIFEDPPPLVPNGTYIELSEFALSGDFIIYGWINVTNTTSYQRIFDFGSAHSPSSTDNNLLIEIIQSGGSPVEFVLYIDTRGIAGTGGSYQISEILDISKSYFVAVTYSSSGLASNLGTITAYIYDTSSNIYTETISDFYKDPAVMGDNDPTSNFGNYIGRSNFSNPILGGNMMEFGIYTSELTSSQIDLLYDTSSP